jgi:hypothetical protein
VSLNERPRGSTRPTPKVHYNSLPKTSIEGALGNVHHHPYDDLGVFIRVRRSGFSEVRMREPVRCWLHSSSGEDKERDAG